jgi:hypothetical protein
MLSPNAEPLPLRLISQSCHFVCLGLQSYFFDYEEWIKKITLYSDFDRSGVCCMVNSGSSGNSAQNETDFVKIYVLYLQRFLVC